MRALAHPRARGVRTWVGALNGDGRCESKRPIRDLPPEDSDARATRYN